MTLGGILFLFFILCYIREFIYFSNTIDSGNLIFKSLGISILISILISYFISRNTESAYDRIREFGMIIFVGLLFAPLLGSWINRGLSKESNADTPISIFEVEKRKVSRFGLGKKDTAIYQYYYFLETPTNLVRFKTRGFEGEPLEKGTQGVLDVDEGFFGYDVIKGFK